MAGFGQAPVFGAQALSTDATNPSVSPFGAPFSSASTLGQQQRTSVFGVPPAATTNAFQQPQQQPSFAFPSSATNPPAANSSGVGGALGSPNVAGNGDMNNNPFASANTASNPFATQKTTVTTGASSNPFSSAVPATTAAPGFGTASNPFAAVNTANGFGASSGIANGSSNFFAKQAGSSDVAKTPFAGATANSQKRKNGFGDASTLKRLAFDSTTTPFQNPQIAFGVKDTRKNHNGFAEYLNSREARGLGPKTARAHSFDTNGVQKSAPVYEKEIRDQLRKDNIHPPTWPRQPGNPANRQAMEDHREKYKKYEGRVRTSLIKAGLIDDPDVRKKLSDAIDFRGICQDMCPEGEKVSRIVEFDVKHAEKTSSPDGLEMWPNPDRMIKSFKRSAAGTDSPLPTDVRSPAALRRTVDYLIDDFLRSDENLPSHHNFLWDRTRAIRKDFIFQNAMTAEERTDQIYCLENIARFHAVALHLLSQEDFAAEDFSEQQEREQLGKTLLSLMQVYDECKDMQGVSMDNEAEFRAYYLLFNAHDPFVKQQMQDWNDKFWFNSFEIQTAVALIEAMQNVWNGRGPLRPQVPLTTGSASFTTYFSIVEDRKVSYTMACFAEIHFTQIRRQLLKSIHKSYGRVRDSPKDLTAKVLNSMLRFDTEEQCVAFLKELDMEFSSDGADEPYLVVERRKSISGKTIRQSFSGVMVERKRGGRSLPQVIHTTVFEDASAAAEASDSPDSMFVTQSAGFAGFGARGDQKVNNLEVNFSDDDTPSSSPQPPLKTLSPFQAPATTKGFPTSDTDKSVLDSAPKNPFLGVSGNPFSQASPNANSTPSTDNSASNAQPKTFSWTQHPPTHSIFGDPPSSESTAKPTAEMPKFSWSTTPADTTNSTQPKEGGSGSGSGSVFGFLHKPAEKSAVSFIPDGAPSTSTTPTVPPTLFSTQSQATEAKPQAPALEPSAKPLGALPPPAKDQDSVPSPKLPTFASPSPTPAPQSSEASQPQASSIFTKPSEMIRSQPAPANMPPPLKPTPPKDLMGDFAEWVVLGDNGLMEEFQEALVTHLVRAVFDQHQQEEEARKLKEEEERSWAKARKFRTYSLRVRYFYRWRDIARKLSLKRVGRHNRAAMKQYREAKLAEAKAAKAKAEKYEQSRNKRLTGPSSWLDELEKDRALKRARRESMSLDTSRRASITSSNADALLATGIFSGMENQRELATECVRDDDSLYDALVGVTIHPNPSQQSMGPPARPKDPLRSVRNAAVAKPAPKPKLSKKAQYLQDLMSGKHREDDLMSFRSSNSSRMARSVATGGKITNFSRYQSSSPRSSAEPERPKNGPGSGIKSSYWLLRSRGLFATPTGHVLSDKAPRPVSGHNHEGGSQYSGDSDAGDLDDRVLEQDGAYRASLGLTGSRRSTFSVPQSATGSPPRHSFLKPKPSMARQSLPAGMSSTSLLASRQPDGDTVSQTGSAISTLQQDAEESLRELKKVAAELDSETEWYREQNRQLSQGQQAFGA